MDGATAKEMGAIDAYKRVRRLRSESRNTKLRRS
jgi:hypothetical protein